MVGGRKSLRFTIAARRGVHASRAGRYGSFEPRPGTRHISRTKAAPDRGTTGTFARCRACAIQRRLCHGFERDWYGSRAHGYPAAVIDTINKLNDASPIGNEQAVR